VFDVVSDGLYDVPVAKFSQDGVGPYDVAMYTIRLEGFFVFLHLMSANDGVFKFVGLTFDRVSCEPQGLFGVPWISTVSEEP